jgi:signal transduction histidine kinase
MQFTNILHSSKEELMVSMDSYDILINNLISNAIKHGEKEKEEILFFTTESTLTISNFGDAALANPEVCFTFIRI